MGEMDRRGRLLLLQPVPQCRPCGLVALCACLKSLPLPCVPAPAPVPPPPPQGKAEVVQRALEVQSLPGALPVQLVQPPNGER